MIRIRIELNIDRQNRIRDLAADAFDVDKDPEIKPRLIGRQCRVGRATKRGIRFAEADDSAESDLPRLIVLAPIGGRGIAVSGNPAAINEDRHLVREMKRGDCGGADERAARER